MTTYGMMNEEGEMVDMYIPRKCHASNYLIAAYDKAAIQIVIADISANGTYTGSIRTFCLAGRLRTQADSDHAINHLCIANGIICPKTGRKTVAMKVHEKTAARETTRAAKRNVPRGRGAQGSRNTRLANKNKGVRPPFFEGAKPTERLPRASKVTSKAAAVAAQ